MAVFKVLTNDINTRSGHRMFVNLDTDAESLEELYKRFQDDKIVCGHQLYTQRSDDEPGVIYITSSKPVIIGREAVYMIEIPNFRFVQEVD